MKKKKNGHRQERERGDEREERDRLELEGVVTEAMPGALFQVKINDGLFVLATLAGRLRINHIRVLPGDGVCVEVSPYDTSKGRIVRRF